MSSASPEEKNDEPIASTSDEASTTNEVSKRKGTKVVREFEFQKIPLPDFVIGDTAVREMLPARILPRGLNPNWVDCDIKELPMIWYGAPYDEKKVIPFAIRNGFGDKRDPEDEIYDAAWTWVNLVDQFHKKFGVYMCLQEVWGLRDRLLLAFHANRDMRIITWRQRKLIQNTYRAMGYKDEEMQWWLDRDEMV